MWDDLFSSISAGATNPLGGMASSADEEEMRRRQAQAAWQSGAGTPAAPDANMMDQYNRLINQKRSLLRPDGSTIIPDTSLADRTIPSPYTAEQPKVYPDSAWGGLFNEQPPVRPAPALSNSAYLDQLKSSLPAVTSQAQTSQQPQQQTGDGSRIESIIGPRQASQPPQDGGFPIGASYEELMGRPRKPPSPPIVFPPGASYEELMRNGAPPAGGQPPQDMQSLFSPDVHAALNSSLAAQLAPSHQSGGATIRDGFTANGGSLYGTPSTSGMQTSPYAALDNYMNQDPVHILGVNGFRTGASRPTVDYSGPQQRQQTIRNNLLMEELLGRQDAASKSNQMDAMKMMLASQDRNDSIKQRRQAEFDRNIKNLPPGKQGPAIDQAEMGNLIPNDVASSMRNRELFDIGALVGGGISKETGKPNNLEGLMRGMAQAYVPGKHDPADIRKRLVGMGISPEQIAQLRRKPGLKDFASAVLGQAGSEYDAMNQAYQDIPWYSSFTENNPQRAEYLKKQQDMQAAWR